MGTIPCKMFQAVLRHFVAAKCEIPSRIQPIKSPLYEKYNNDIDVYSSHRAEQNDMLEPRNKINPTTQICESALNLCYSRVNCRSKTFTFFVQGAPHIKGISSRIHQPLFSLFSPLSTIMSHSGLIWSNQDIEICGKYLCILSTGGKLKPIFPKTCKT